jgi:2'-5' RNA ligase
MRAFIALAIPEEARQRLVQLQSDLRASRADVKWVEPENLHVTLKFLGEISEEERQAVEHMLRRIATATAPFPLGLSGVGAFPSLGAPRVIWVGLGEGSEAAAHLAQMIEREGASIPIPKEDRPFSAHLTLGRVRSPRGRQELVGRLRQSRWQPPSAWQVNAVRLYQSVLGSGGPQYTVLAEVPFADVE